MTSTLNCYRANGVSSTLATANRVYINNEGAPTTNQTYTQLGTATGFGTIYPQGNTNPWTAGGSLNGPLGVGFFLDDTTLDGQTIPAGNWSGTIRLVAAIGTSGALGGNFTADLYTRVWRYRPSTAIYTLIVTMFLAAQAANNTITTYTYGNSAGISMDFAVGDKLYIQDDCNVTANTSGSTETIRINRLSTAGVTLLGDPAAKITTPGYNPTPSGPSQIVLRQFHRSFGHIQ